MSGLVINSYISTAWTQSERMGLVFIVADIIRDSINSNKYGAPGVPNVQSIHELMALDSHVLETQRVSTEKLISDYEKHHPGFSFIELINHYDSLVEGN